MKIIGTSEVAVSPASVQNATVVFPAEPGHLPRTMAVQIKEMLPSPRSKGKFASSKMKETDTSPKPRSAAGSPAPSDMLTAEHLEKKAASQDARAYLESHRVLQFVQELLEQLVRDKPEDPYGCMSDRLSKKMQCTSSETERTGRRPRLSKDEPDEDIDKHLLALIANQNAALAEDNDRLRTEINQMSLLEAADIQNMEVRKTRAIATVAGQNAKLDTDNSRLRLDIEKLRQRERGVRRETGLWNHESYSCRGTPERLSRGDVFSDREAFVCDPEVGGRRSQVDRTKKS